MGSICFPGKSSWPELVGCDGEKAAAVIEEERPDVKAQIVKPGDIIDMMFSCVRVVVVVNEDGIVTRVPVIG